MLAGELQKTVEKLEPDLECMARDLNISSSELIENAVTEQKKQWAISKLEQIASDARSSGYHPVTDEKSWLEKVRNRALEKKSDVRDS